MIRDRPFPTFRENQKSLIQDIETLIKERLNLLLVAPNGTGKTIIALSGILPIIQQNDLKLIYLCRTHAQADRAIRELQAINSHLSDETIRGISIRGRTQMCLNSNMRRVSSSSEATGKCKELRGGGCRWYRKVKRVRGNLIEKCPELFEGPLTGGDIKTYAKEHSFCPYFLSKYLMGEVKVVVCNYNWVFNLSILYGFLKLLNTELNKSILVIDECHNIPEVATSISSKKVSPTMLTKCLTQLDNYPQFTKRQRKFVHLLKNFINNKKKSITQGEIPIEPEVFIKKICKIKEIRNLKKLNISLNNGKTQVKVKKRNITAFIRIE